MEASWRAVKKDAGAAGLDAVAGDGAGDERERDLDGVGVFEGGELDLDGRGMGGVGGVERGVGLEAAFALLGAVVEVAEGAAAEGHAFAFVPVGLDVAAFA